MNKFGVKVSLAIAARRRQIADARSFGSDPYDRYTLHAQLVKSAILLQGLPGSPKPNTAIVDLGDRDADAKVAPVQVIHRGKQSTQYRRQRSLLNRRQAVEPVIGHVKVDHGMQLNWLREKPAMPRIRSSAPQASICAGSCPSSAASTVVTAASGSAEIAQSTDRENDATREF